MIEPTHRTHRDTSWPGRPAAPDAPWMRDGEPWIGELGLPVVPAPHRHHPGRRNAARPGARPAQPAPPGHPAVPVLVGMLVALATACAVVLGLLVMDGGTPVTTGTGPAHARIAALDGLLEDNLGVRQDVSGAAISIRMCRDVEDAQRTLLAAARHRDQQLARLSAMDLTGLAQGPQLADALRRAWAYSADSDRRLAAWADEVLGGSCLGTAETTPVKQAADEAGAAATRAKHEFVVLWNPLAAREGLPERAEADI